MITCNICGCQKATAREMHGHLVRVHYDDYMATDKGSGAEMEQLTTGYIKKKKEGKEEMAEKVTEKKRKAAVEKDPFTNDKPVKLRLLNKSNADELYAYNQGYRYLDPDEGIAYTTAEVKEEGWI